MRNPSRVGTVAVAAGTLAGVVLPGVAQAAPSQQVRHVGSRPSWATAGRDVGPASAKGSVTLRVWLAVQHAAELRSLAAAVSTPGNASYGHYLTPTQFDARYAPTASQADAVASWLRSAGLRVTTVASTHRYVAASGSVAQVQRALSVQLDNFKVGADVWRAPANDPAVPSSIAATVAGFTGLDTGDHAMRPTANAPAPPAAFVNAPPLSDQYGQKTANVEADGTTPLPTFNGAYLPYAVRGYTPPDYRSAYGLSGSGAGVTIAITDAYFSASMVSDANRYAAAHDPSSPPLVAGGNYLETVPATLSHQGQCGASGWEGEESLDVEAAHGIAPGATIHYFGATSCFDADLLDTLQQTVDDPAVDIVTNSWSGYEAGETPDTVAAYEQVFQQGTVEGKAFLFSSGDDGDELAATGTKQVDYPSSDPYVIGVGGTSIGIAGGRLVGQTGWGTQKASLGTGAWTAPHFLYGSGGGCSMLFAQPSWQSVKTGCAGQRGVPDISMDGDPTTGMLVGETQTFPRHVVDYGEYRIGGTSLASPLFAGVLALVDQQAAGQGGANVSGPAAIYSLRSGVTDVVAQTARTGMPDAGNVRADYANSVDPSGGTLYSVRTFGQDSSLAIGRGWDQATGLGTVSSKFVAALAAAAPAAA
jgi:subtilase family serine protease